MINMLKMLILTRRIRLFATQFAPAHNFRVPVTSYIMSVWRGNVEITREFGVGLNNSSPCNRCNSAQFGAPGQTAWRVRKYFFRLHLSCARDVFSFLGRDHAREQTDKSRHRTRGGLFEHRASSSRRFAAITNRRRRTDTPDGKQRLSN